MQVLKNKTIEYVTNFKCEICGENLEKKEMKDIIMLIHGDIEHDIEEHKAFREVTQTIYMHKNCMKFVLNDKFHNTWELFFNNQY